MRLILLFVKRYLLVASEPLPSISYPGSRLLVCLLKCSINHCLTILL